MIYNLALKEEVNQAFEYLTKLAGQDAIAKIVKVSPNRSLAQNSYLHLLLGAFGSHFGYTLEEAKTIYKQINASVYSYEKKGRKFERSSSDLTKDEMTNTIDKFMRASAEAGCDLPKADDREWLTSIENEMERNSRYL